MQLGSRELKGTAVRAAARPSPPPANPFLLPGSSEALVSTGPGWKAPGTTDTLHQIHRTGSPETSFQRGLILGPRLAPAKPYF